MIDDAELTAIRDDAEELLPSTATILTYARTSDGAGGFRSTYVPQGSVPCRLSPIGGGETGKPGGRVSERTTHMVTVPAETVIEEKDRLQVGGAVYEITLVRKRPGLEFTRRIEVREATS